MANLCIPVTSKSISDIEYIKKKYTDFAVTKSRSTLSGYTTEIDHDANKRFVVKNKVIKIPIKDIKKRFLHFNDLLRQAFAIILNSHDGLLLHASVLVYRKKAYAFVGPEGAGKSTIRKNSLLLCLGDDVGIIRKEQNAYYVYGSPFYQKTNRAYPNIRVPLAGLYWIKQAPYLLLEHMPASERFGKFLSQVFFTPGQSLLEKSRQLHTALSLVESIPCFTLSLTKHSPIWPFITMVSPKTNKYFASNRQKFRPIVNKYLPNGLVWKTGIASLNFLGSCFLIKEQSWNFELGNARRVSDVALRIQKSQLRTHHTQVIYKKMVSKTFSAASLVISLLHVSNKYIILDGNHTAIALYLLKKEMVVPIQVADMLNTTQIPWL